MDLVFALLILAFLTRAVFMSREEEERMNKILEPEEARGINQIVYARNACCKL